MRAGWVHERGKNFLQAKFPAIQYMTFSTDQSMCLFAVELEWSNYRDWQALRSHQANSLFQSGPYWSTRLPKTGIYSRNFY